MDSSKSVVPSQSETGGRPAPAARTVKKARRAGARPGAVGIVVELDEEVLRQAGDRQRELRACRQAVRAAVASGDGEELEQVFGRARAARERYLRWLERGESR